MICSACGGSHFEKFAIRADGMEIMQCSRCGLGVVAQLPDSTVAFYGDGYYGNASGNGYDDYGAMAEHGLGWAAALVELVAAGGRILDIGCADGYLLQKLGQGFEKFGIEANARAAEMAQAEGVRVLGNDLLAPSFSAQWSSAFDVVTAIAVFEHLLDFRRGFEVAVDALREDGVLLFEVPVMSETGSNAAWMQGSFEHIFYPTESSIRYIVETVLGCRLVGSELLVRDYASTYVGLVTRNAARAAHLEGIFQRVMKADFEHGADAEIAAATQLHLLHAAQSCSATVKALARLPIAAVNPSLLARIGQLWSFDLDRLQAARQDAAQAEGNARESQTAAIRATEAAALEVKRTEALRAQLDAMQAHAAALTHHIGVIESSTLWRATGLLRRIGSRYPALARRSTQIAKLVWWTVKGTLFDHIREFRRRRGVRAAKAEASERAQHSAVELLAETGVVAGELDPPADLPWPADRPLVSVVIPCFNYGHLVEEAIQSVHEQTFADLEIVVVEGGSSSVESKARLAEAARKMASPRLRVIWQDRPHRAGANRNTGISHARGKYICCLDADDRLAPTYIEKAVFVLDEGYDVVSPALRFFGKRSEVFAPHERPTLDMLLEGNQVLTCAMFRKSFWKLSGGYRDSDPATGHLHEDWLFWVRLAALGARFVSIREPLFHYRSHEGTLSNSESVLENHLQSLAIRRFNSDVLTPEALARARGLVGPAPRSPQAFRPAARHRLAAASGPTLLLAMPYLILGGAERLLSAIVRNLVKSGWRVVVVTTIAIDESHGDTTGWFEDATPEIFHLPRFLEPVYWKDFVERLFAYRRIDVAWVVGSAFFYDCLPALRLRHPALKVADLLFNTQGHTANNRRYADCIDVTFVENSEVRDWLLEAGETPERIRLVESGVDLVDNAPPADSAKVRSDYALPADALLVGFFGRWSGEKDPLGFVEIARRVPANLDVTFVMTGAGPMEAELRQAISAAGFAPGRFLLKGAVPDLKPYLRACDVLVLPSRLDGRPNVVMEALASGVAVVASHVGALPEMFDDGRQGHLCPIGDYDCFAARIAEFASDRDKLARFKREARAHAERRLDIRRMLDAYEEQLKALVEAS